MQPITTAAPVQQYRWLCIDIETANARPEEAEPTVPLEAGLDRFWDLASSLNEFQAVIEAPQVDGAAIKRLGSPGFWRNSKVDFVGALTHAYQSVTQASLGVALGDGDE